MLCISNYSFHVLEPYWYLDHILDHLCDFNLFFYYFFHHEGSYNISQYKSFDNNNDMPCMGLLLILIKKNNYIFIPLKNFLVVPLPFKYHMKSFWYITYGNIWSFILFFVVIVVHPPCDSTFSPFEYITTMLVWWNLTTVLPYRSIYLYVLFPIRLAVRLSSSAKPWHISAFVSLAIFVILSFPTNGYKFAGIYIYLIITMTDKKTILFKNIIILLTHLTHYNNDT